MATKIFETKYRNESHAKLAEILAADEKSLAECREDAARGLYSVWDGPEPEGPREGQIAPPSPEETASAKARDQDALADLVAEKLLQKMARASEATKAADVEPAAEEKGTN